jgi:aldose 1-epimerase
MQRKTTATRAPFGAMPDGSAVEIFTLTNLNGLELRAINYGAIIVSLKVPDKSGRFDDIVNGHDSLDGYLTRSRFFGAVVGRYGNRIAKGKFTIDGVEYTLAVNNARIICTAACAASTKSCGTWPRTRSKLDREKPRSRSRG